MLNDASTNTQHRSVTADQDIRLPFAFARRFGVVLTNAADANAANADATDTGGLEIWAKSQPSLATLAEIRRLTKVPAKVRLVSSEA
ncbi:MAG TPA: hypothetical protein DE147_06475, partial [Gammaproteobacteria bacterium]|nr:hypothetical protein [Gammaproteobacteria bacterium]